MRGLITRRLLQLPIIMLIVYTIAFTLAWVIPGNPLDNAEGRRPPDEIMQAMLEQYKLDNYWSFYWDYLGKATGVSWALDLHDQPFDMGPSLTHENWTVNEILATGLPVSITVGLTAIMLACAIGIAAGVIGGIRPGSALDFGTFIIAVLGISLPTFVIGTGLLVAFSVLLPIFPIGGWGNVTNLVLPALTLSLPFAAYIARLTRFGMIDQLESDYVRTARAKGLAEYRVVLKHALKNALLPVLSYLGPASAMAMTGSFVVEKVFAVPGIGARFVDAVLSKDLTLILGILLTGALMLAMFYLFVDVLYRWIDPRIELG